jgi:transcriptional regulator with XRE-family HTH domain
MGRKPKAANRSTYRGRFAANLRKLRLAKFDSQDQFRAALAQNGIKATIPTISGWERGYRSPAVENLPAIAKTLGVSPADLLPAR